MKHWFPDWKGEPKDLDIFSRTGDTSRDIEIFWFDAFSYIEDNNNNIDSVYVDANLLYTLKVSHAHWNVKWDKTLAHIIFMKEKGCVLNREFYDLLIEQWNETHGKKDFSLNGSNEDFFTEKATRKVPHDTLHELLAFNKRPMHELIREDINSPMCSKLLWDFLSHEDKVKTCLEEIYVIATERFILPKGYSPNRAKYNSFKQLITTMTKGWFPLFMLENAKEILNSKEEDKLWITKLQKLRY